MKILLPILMLMTSTICLASGAEHGGEEAGIPFDKIGIQALNLGILVVALIFFVRKSIIDAFTQRQVNYNEQSQKTAAALKLAEAELKDIKDKLSVLESSEASSIQKAQAEAESLKNKMISEAQTQAEKLKQDVALIIGAEVYKAKTEIRSQIIEKSISSAKESVRAAAQTITEKSEKGFIADLGQVKA